MTIISRQRLGINTTVHPANSLEGTLLVCRNAHITRGGEVEKRQAFTPWATLPAGCVGFKGLGRRLTVFGTGERPAALSAQIRYERLSPPAGSGVLEKVNGAALFGGKVYAIGRFSTGSVIHFYGGVPVPYWQDNQETGDDTIDAVVATLAGRIDSTPTFFATAAGSTMTVSAAEDFSFQAQVYNSEGQIVSTVVQEFEPARPSVQPIASMQFDGDIMSLDSLEIITAASNSEDILSPGNTVYRTGTLEEFAAAVAARINRDSAFDATSEGNMVIIHAPPGTGTQYEGAQPIANVSTGGNPGHVNITNFLGGSDAVPLVDKVVEFFFSGAFESDATYQIILNGRDFSKLGSTGAASDFVLSFRNKVWVAVGEYLHFSALNDALEWRPFIPGEEGNEEMSVGAGYMRITDEAGEAGFIRGMSPFGEFLAVFAENAVAFVSVDPDPDNTYRVGEIIPNTGTRFGNALFATGAQDVLYLSSRGVESLRLRAQVQAPTVQGIGAPVASLFSQGLSGIGESSLDTVQATSDGDGRIFWSVGNQALVWSEFPEAGVQAWSTYDMPSQVDAMARVQGTVYVLCGTSIYKMGGYDSTEVEVVSFFSDRGDPRQQTEYRNLMVAVLGTWRIDALTDPWDFRVRVPLGQDYSDAKPNDGAYPTGFAAGTCALRLFSKAPGPQTICKVALG